MLNAPDYTCAPAGAEIGPRDHTWPADTPKRKKKCPRCAKPARPLKP